MKISIAGLLMIISSQTSAYAFSFNDCNKIASLINKDLPQAIDKITTLTSTTCIPGSNRIKLVYVNEVSSNDFTARSVSSLYQKQLNQWCTNNEMRKSFALADIDYTYFTKDGKHIGTNHLKFAACNK